MVSFEDAYIILSPIFAFSSHLKQKREIRWASRVNWVARPRLPRSWFLEGRSQQVGQPVFSYKHNNDFVTKQGTNWTSPVKQPRSRAYIFACLTLTHHPYYLRAWNRLLFLFNNLLMIALWLIIHQFREQGRHRGESAHIPPKWPGFDAICN